MKETEQTPVKLAGFFRQLKILLWKNSLLFQRKKLATLSEILLALSFISMLLIIRYFVEKVYIPDQTNPVYNAIDYFQVISGKNLILFYPNNPFIERIVSNAYEIIKARKNWLNATVQAAEFASLGPDDLNSTVIKRLIAFISFPTNYSVSLPDNVEYKIYTEEYNDL